MAYLLAILSASISLIFVAYGFFVAFSGGFKLPVLFFALPAIGYGLASLFCLHLSVNTLRPYAAIIKYASLGFLVAYLIGSLDLAIISGLELAGFMFALVIVICNWVLLSSIHKNRAGA